MSTDNGLTGDGTHPDHLVEDIKDVADDVLGDELIGAINPMPSEESIGSLASETKSLNGMKTLFQKELPKLSVDRYFQNFWADETNSFFKSWLVEDGKREVVVGKWLLSSENTAGEGSFVNPYDQETYDQKSVTLRVQVGLDIVFKEQVLVASRIKANTLQEMTQAQLSLFRAMKNGSVKDTDTIKQGKNQFQKAVSLLFPFANAFASSRNDAQLSLEEAQTKLARVRSLPSKVLPADLDEQRISVMAEMHSVHEALDSILLQKFLAPYPPPPPPPVSNNDKSAPPYVELATEGLQVVQSSWDKVMRAIAPRKIQLRNPEPFLKKDHEADDQSNVPEKRDTALAKMELIVSSTIAGISVQAFADIFLTNEQGQSGFYADWLRKTGRRNVQITPWDIDDSLGSFVDSFSGESFAWHRTVSAAFDKAYFSNDESPSLESTQNQEQFYRMEDGTSLVLATTTKLGNIPFAEAFDIHTRWVVTKLSKAELSVKVGLAVVFKREGVLLEPKIRAGATREGRKTQIDLLLKIRSMLGRVAETRTLSQRDAVAEALTPTPRLIDFILKQLKECSPRALSDLLDADNALHEEFEDAKLKLRSVELFIKDCERRKDLVGMKVAVAELNVVNDALDNIVDRHGDGDGSSTLAAAGLL